MNQATDQVMYCTDLLLCLTVWMEPVDLNASPPPQAPTQLFSLIANAELRVWEGLDES